MSGKLRQKHLSTRLMLTQILSLMRSLLKPNLLRLRSSSKLRPRLLRLLLTLMLSRLQLLLMLRRKLLHSSLRQSNLKVMPKSNCKKDSPKRDNMTKLCVRSMPSNPSLQIRTQSFSETNRTTCLLRLRVTIWFTRNDFH